MYRKARANLAPKVLPVVTGAARPSTVQRWVSRGQR